MTKDKLPNHLRAWRKRAGFTQIQAEKILGWPHGRVSHLENGSAHVTQEVLDALGPIYAKNASDLLDAPPQIAINFPSVSPRRRKKTGSTLSDSVAILQQLMGELQAIKTDHAERLSKLEQKVKRAASTISEAIQETELMTERWQQDLSTLQQAVRPSVKKTDVNND